MEFRILGTLEVEEDGRVLKLGSAKQRAVLAFLLLHANEVVPRDRLIDEIWAEDVPETAATAVQVYVSQLRKVLGREVIVTQAPGYLVRVQDGELDLERFEQLVAQARTEEPARAAATLRSALALWRGAPLAELDMSFARPERARLEEQRLAALEQRIAADLELGGHAELVPELERLVHEHPLRERLRGQLMLALYRSGRQAEALDTYRSGRRLLDEELGLEPGEELRRLERAILEHDRSLAAPNAGPEPPGTDGTPAAASPALQSEERRGRWIRHSRVLVALGVLVLAASATALAVALTTRDRTQSVAVLPNSVAVIDPTKGDVVADISMGGRPVSLAAGENAIWVANADDGTVSRIDPKSYEVVRTIGLGADVDYVAVGFGSVWVAGGNDEKLFRIDPRQNAVQATLELGRADPLRPRPVFFVVTGRKAVWALQGDTLLRIDPATNKVTSRTRMPDTPEDLGAGAGDVWVTTQDERLVRVDEGSATITAVKPLPGAGASPIVTGDGLRLIVYADSPQLSTFDPSTVVQRATVPFPPGSFPFALSAGNGVVSAIDNAGGVVWTVRPARGRLARIARLPHHPISVATSDDAIWVGVQARGL